MLQDGVLTKELQLLITTCSEVGVSRESLQAFLHDPEWCFPRGRLCKGRELHRIFDDRRRSDQNPNKIKASLSELLGVYGLVRHFLDAHIDAGGDDLVLRSLASFRGACRIVDLIVLAKAKIADTTEVAMHLQRAMSDFLDLHKAAYGTGHVLPKHHWMMDVPQQIAKDGFILDAFVIERTHLMVKTVADHVENTRIFEASVLRGVVNAKLLLSKSAIGCDTLLGRMQPVPGHEAMVIADRMLVSTFEVCVSDFVVLGSFVGRVVACVCELNTLLLIVETFAVVARIGTHTVVARGSRASEVWRASDVQHAIAWRCNAEDGSITIVLV
jgi:hypothetical protein